MKEWIITFASLGVVTTVICASSNNHPTKSIYGSVNKTQTVPDFDVNGIQTIERLNEIATSNSSFLKIPTALQNMYVNRNNVKPVLHRVSKPFAFRILNDRQGNTYN